jgi:hypothetical protein
LQVRYGIKYQEGCSSIEGEREMTCDEYYKQRTRIKVLQELGLGMFFTSKGTMEEALYGSPINPTAIAINSGTQETMIFSGEGVSLDIDESFFQKRETKQRYIFSGESTVIGQRYDVLQVEIENAL